MSGIDFIHYNSKSKQKDIIIWCPHDGDHEEFFQKYSKISSLLLSQHKADLLKKYLAIEKDFGSLFLAKNIAENLKIAQPNLSISVIYATIPRGIIDLGRISSHAQRNILYKETPLEILQLLKNMHAESLRQLTNIISDLNPLGIFLDLHSMAPCDPNVKRATQTEYLIETPSTLEEYVKIYCQSQYNGIRRPIDLITAKRTKKPIADQELTTTLSQQLENAGFLFGYNVPFCTDDHLIAANIMEQVRGITVDIPKDFITNESINDVNFDLANLSINQNKVNKLAVPIANALIAALQISTKNVAQDLIA